MKSLEQGKDILEVMTEAKAFDEWEMSTKLSTDFERVKMLTELLPTPRQAPGLDSNFQPPSLETVLLSSSILLFSFSCFFVSITRQRFFIDNKKRGIKGKH